MPCPEVGQITVEQYGDYDDDEGSSGKTFDSDSDFSGSDDTAASAPLPTTVHSHSRGKWLKTLRKIIDKMDGKSGGRRQRQVKTILRPPTTYVFVIGMSGLPSKVAVYPRWMWRDPQRSGRQRSDWVDVKMWWDITKLDSTILSLFCRTIYIDLFLVWFSLDNIMIINLILWLNIIINNYNILWPSNVSNNYRCLGIR